MVSGAAPFRPQEQWLKSGNGAIGHAVSCVLGMTIGGQVEKILQTHRFGPHRVDVLERAGNEGATYVVLVDGAVITDPPLETPPRLEDVVRIYADSQGRI